jgi:hypothetical protein
VRLENRKGHYYIINIYWILKVFIILIFTLILCNKENLSSDLKLLILKKKIRPEPPDSLKPKPKINTETKDSKENCFSKCKDFILKAIKFICKIIFAILEFLFELLQRAIYCLMKKICCCEMTPVSLKKICESIFAFLEFLFEKLQRAIYCLIKKICRCEITPVSLEKICESIFTFLEFLFEKLQRAIYCLIKKICSCEMTPVSLKKICEFIFAFLELLFEKLQRVTYCLMKKICCCKRTPVSLKKICEFIFAFLVLLFEQLQRATYYLIEKIFRFDMTTLKKVTFIEIITGWPLVLFISAIWTYPFLLFSFHYEWKEFKIRHNYPVVLEYFLNVILFYFIVSYYLIGFRCVVSIPRLRDFDESQLYNFKNMSESEFEDFLTEVRIWYHEYIEFIEKIDDKVKYFTPFIYVLVLSRLTYRVIETLHMSLYHPVKWQTFASWFMIFVSYGGILIVSLIPAIMISNVQTKFKTLISRILAIRPLMTSDFEENGSTLRQLDKIHGEKKFLKELNKNAPQFTIAGLLSITTASLSIAQIFALLPLWYHKAIEIYPFECITGTVRDYYECSNKTIDCNNSTFKY